MKPKVIAVAAGTILALTCLRPAIAIVQVNPVILMLDDIELTQAQQQQATNIGVDTRAEISDILTAHQRRQLLRSWIEQHSVPEAIANLNLTGDQRQQLREVLQDTLTELSTILTPGQYQQIRDNLSDRIQHL